jgi:hypothetical protein
MHIIISVDQLNKNEIDSAYGSYGRQERCIGFWWRELKKIYRLKNQEVDGRIILNQIFKNLDGRMDWIELAQDRDRWLAVVKAVMNIRVP